MAIKLPKKQFIAVEGSLKKSNFLKKVVDSLPLKNLTIIHHTALPHSTELQKQLFKTKATAITARALGSLEKFYKVGYPHLAKGGKMITTKNPTQVSELRLLEKKYPYISIETVVRPNRESFFVIISHKSTKKT